MIGLKADRRGLPNANSFNLPCCVQSADLDTLELRRIVIYRQLVPLLELGKKRRSVDLRAKDIPILRDRLP